VAPVRWRIADGLAVLLLGLLTLAAYGRLLDPSVMLVDYDALVYFYPLRAYAAAAVQQGRLPLWNPSSFGGAPFLANPQTALFYPLTALFFWLAVPYAYSLNLVLHVFLAGVCFYAFGRLCLEARPAAALVGGAVFMLGGVLSGQYGHLNQLSAAAWLPLVLLLGHRAVSDRSLRLALLGGCALALQLLAGHPQQTYMTLVALGLMALWALWGRSPRALVAGGGRLVALLLSGFALAAVQLVPTAELARDSVRGAGLGYRDAVAGSLWPWLLARAVLPSFVNDLGSTEYLGYLGVAPLLLAALALGVAERRWVALGLLLVVPGLALALGGANKLYPLLYEHLPGLASFRVPARWLLLFTVGGAVLAARGLEWLLERRGGRPGRTELLRLAGTAVGLLLLWLLAYLGGVRATRQLQLIWLGLTLACVLLGALIWQGRWRRAALAALLALVGVELWAAGGDLAPRQPVPNEAYAQPRDSTLFLQSRLGADRFLSIASEDYELKESPDYREWFAHLPEAALSDFLVAAKRNEVLAPNLQLLYGLDSLDGYDGGLLPLGHFLRLASVLVPPDRVRPDGVLVSRLESLPPRPLLDLLNLRIVLTNRARDHEQDGIEYDRAIQVDLRPGERWQIERLPGREYSHLGLIAALDQRGPPDGQTVGRIEIVGLDGSRQQIPLRFGIEIGPARPPDGWVRPPLLQELKPTTWMQAGDPVEYLARLPLARVAPAVLSFEQVAATGSLRVQAATLIDERDGSFTSLVLDDRLERTRFFDMKVYEHPDALPRTYLVGEARELDDEAAAELLRRGGHDPRRAALVEPGSGLSLPAQPGPAGRVQVLESEPERLRLQVSAERPAWLVVGDGYYPGWTAALDGQPAPLVRTNLAFKGLPVPAGDHTVELSLAPRSLAVGLAITLVAALVVLAVLARGRR
jgi:hypothetical protein